MFKILCLASNVIGSNNEGGECMSSKAFQINVIIMRKNVRSLICLFILSLMLGCGGSKREVAKPSSSNSHIVKINGETFEMIYVEGGSFKMGCTPEQSCDCDADEKPVRQVNVPSFYIGKYEITQKQWNSIVGAAHNPSKNKGCENCPVENVSWNDANFFVQKLSILTNTIFRLPTEEEWEYAARGGNLSKGYKYSGSNNVDEVAWYFDNYKKDKVGSLGTTHPVGTKQPNELGIHDMSGNVWEWCSNLYAEAYERSGSKVAGWPYPGQKARMRNVLRGASWGGSPKGCRVSCRDFDFNSYKDEYGGFRIVFQAKSDSAIVSKK